MKIVDCSIPESEEENQVASQENVESSTFSPGTSDNEPTDETRERDAVPNADDNLIDGGYIQRDSTEAKEQNIAETEPVVEPDNGNDPREFTDKELLETKTPEVETIANENAAVGSSGSVDGNIDRKSIEQTVADTKIENEPPTQEKSKIVSNELWYQPDASNGSEKQTTPPVRTHFLFDTIDDFITELKLPDTPSLFKEESKRWAQEIDKYRALVLFSTRTDALESAIRSLMDNIQFSATALKYVFKLRALKTRLAATEKIDHAAFKDSNNHLFCSGNDFDLCFLPTKDDGDSDTQRLLVVDATDILARDFVQELFQDQLFGWEEIARRLIWAKRYLVVLTKPENLPDGYTQTLKLPVYQIPYHRLIIGNHLRHDSDRVSELIEKFERERDSGVLGDTEEVQYLNLESSLKKEDERAINMQPPSIGDDPLIDAVLFLAVFFSGVSESDYHDLLIILLGDELDPLWQPPQSHEDPAPSRPLLKKRWTNNEEKVLASAGLRIMQQPQLGALEAKLSDGRSMRQKYAVAFVNRANRVEFEAEYLSNHRLKYLRYLGILLQAGTLFHRNPEVVASFVRVAVEVATTDPSRYGSRWILDLVFSAGPEANALQVKEHGSPVAEVLYDFRQELYRQRRDLIHDRLKKLTVEMLKYPPLEPSIRRTIEYLFDAKFYSVILELTWKLAGVQKFDSFFWLRRILDESNAPFPSRAEDQLFSLALRRLNAHALLRCRQWIEKGNSRSSLAAFRLIVTLGEYSFFKSPLAYNSKSEAQVRLATWLVSDANTSELLIHLMAQPSFLSWLDNTRCWRRDQEFWFLHINTFLRNWFFTTSVRKALETDGAVKLAISLDEVWNRKLEDLRSQTGMPRSSTIFSALVIAEAVCLSVKDSENKEPFSSVNIETSDFCDSLERAFENAELRRMRAIWLAIEESFSCVKFALENAGDSLGRKERKELKSLRRRSKNLSSILRQFRSNLNKIKK